ncbi:MAG: methyltransferase domain-containing protein [Planctomycetes bacterium]|nr:methyltransferase domain-containing protein [Planctomycetota bacterium]
MNATLVFLKQVLRHQRRIGAVLPSSSFLAREMVRGIREDGGPKRVLEVGAGTGTITRRILAQLADGDELLIVEMEPEFVRYLEEKVLKPFRALHPGRGVTVRCAMIEDVEMDRGFGHIICSLPFNAMPPVTVRSIFRHLLASLAEGGELSYFAYWGQHWIQAPLIGRAGRRRLRSIRVIHGSLKRLYHGQRRLVLWNLLPAQAVRLRPAARPPRPLLPEAV